MLGVEEKSMELFLSEILEEGTQPGKDVFRTPYWIGVRNQVDGGPAAQLQGSQDPGRRCRTYPLLSLQEPWGHCGKATEKPVRSQAKKEPVGHIKGRAELSSASHEDGQEFPEGKGPGPKGSQPLSGPVTLGPGPDGSGVPRELTYATFATSLTHSPPQEKWATHVGWPEGRGRGMTRRASPQGSRLLQEFIPFFRSISCISSRCRKGTDRFDRAQPFR